MICLLFIGKKTHFYINVTVFRNNTFHRTYLNFLRYFFGFKIETEVHTRLIFDLMNFLISMSNLSYPKVNNLRQKKFPWLTNNWIGFYRNVQYVLFIIKSKPCLIQLVLTRNKDYCYLLRCSRVEITFILKPKLKLNGLLGLISNSNSIIRIVNNIKSFLLSHSYLKSFKNNSAWLNNQNFVQTQFFLNIFSFLFSTDSEFLLA
jgi:hypothetical protein